MSIKGKDITLIFGLIIAVIIVFSNISPLEKPVQTDNSGSVTYLLK